MKNLLKNLALFLFSCLFGLLILEVALRVYDPFQFRITGDSITLRANFTETWVNHQTTKLDSQIVFSKNNLGFRGPDKPGNLEDYLSIVAVGGSTTECRFSTDGKDWPSLLGNKLAADFSMTWLNNAGLDGHSTHGHQVLLNDYLVALKPSVALFYVGINDMGRSDLNSFDKAAIKGNTGSFRDFLLEKSKVANAGFNLLRAWRAKKLNLTHNLALDLANAPVLEQTDGEREAFLQRAEKDWLPGYRSRLQSLVDTCRRHGIEPVFITQPVLFGEGIDSLTGTNLEKVEVWPEANGKTLWEMLQRYNAVTMEVARQNGCHAIDLGSMFPKTSAYYYDFLHYTNEGCEVLAGLVFRELKPWLEERFSQNRILEGEN